MNDVLTELERERNNIVLEKSIYLLAANQIHDEKEKSHASKMAGAEGKGVPPGIHRTAPHAPHLTCHEAYSNALHSVCVCVCVCVWPALQVWVPART